MIFRGIPTSFTTQKCYNEGKYLSFREVLHYMERFKNNHQLIDYLKLETTSSLEFHKIVLQKNDYILTEFEKAQHLFFVSSGFLSVDIQEESRYFISAFIFENDFFGLDAFSSFPSKNHAIKVISSDAIIYRIEKQFLLTVLNKRPELYELLLTNFTDIFQRHYLFEDFLSLSPIERIQKALSYLSDFIGQINDQDQVEMPSEITQEVLARFCRTSQSRVSVCLKEIKKTTLLPQ